MLAKLFQFVRDSGSTAIGEMRVTFFDRSGAPLQHHMRTRYLPHLAKPLSQPAQMVRRPSGIVIRELLITSLKSGFFCASMIPCAPLAPVIRVQPLNPTSAFQNRSVGPNSAAGALGVDLS